MNIAALASRMDERTDKTGDCWVVRGKDRHYPHISYGAGRYVAGHRLAWTVAHGPIPAGMHVLHRCDNKRCVRPDHLFLGTHADNMADIASKGTHWIYRRPWRMRVGEDHPNAKLTAEQVRLIRLEAEAGRPYSHLAREFGVAKATIGRIVQRKGWIAAGAPR